MSIANLRRSRGTAIQAINKAIADSNKKGGGQKDDGFWKPFLDEDKGIGQAVIRFLPAPDGEELPFALVYDHGFQGPASRGAKYYFNNSLTTLGQKDPVSEMNGRLWKTGFGDNPAIKGPKGYGPDKKLASSMHRRTNYYANILVLSDPGRPQNEGKVFKYRFGPAIYKMIEMKTSPEADKFTGETPESQNPFCFWDGFNLDIRIYRDGDKGQGFWKYDQTKWQETGELFPGDDAAKEAVWKQCSSIKFYTSPENFKSYADLAKKLLEVMGPEVGSGVATVEGVEEAAPVEKPAMEYATQPSTRSQVVVPEPASAPVAAPAAQDSAPWGDDDGDMEFFKSAAKGQ